MKKVLFLKVLPTYFQRILILGFWWCNHATTILSMFTFFCKSYPIFIAHCVAAVHFPIWEYGFLICAKALNIAINCEMRISWMLWTTFLWRRVCSKSIGKIIIQTQKDLEWRFSNPNFFNTLNLILWSQIVLSISSENFALLSLSKI